MTLHADANKREINFKRFRDVVGEQFDVSSVLVQDSEGAFEDSELFNMFQINREIYSAMLNLNYCFTEVTCCPKCGKDMWMSTQRIGGKEEESVYFERLSHHALKALITGLLGSSLNHPNKSFTGDIVDFKLPAQSSLPKDFSIPGEDELIRLIR